MKKEIVQELLKTKALLLLLPCHKRQSQIDKLHVFVTDYLSKFYTSEINKLKKQVSYLSEEEKDELYSKYFPLYVFLKFGKGRLEVDLYNPDYGRTFAQFNDLLRLCFMVE